jgi:hypothetical protein
MSHRSNNHSSPRDGGSAASATRATASAMVVGWASLVIRAHLRGRLSGAELWDILLAHMDDCFAPQRVAKLLGYIDRVLPPEPLKNGKSPRRPEPAGPTPKAGAIDPDLIVLAEDENRELLSA